MVRNKMDYSTADVLTNAIRDSSGNDSSSSDDLIPLSKLLARPQTEEKHSHDKQHSANDKSRKDRSASDESLDDKPLIELKRSSTTAKKPVRKINTPSRSIGTNDKKTGLNADESSDSEPLIEIVKKASKAVKKPSSVSPKKSVDSKKKEPLDGDSSGDEPLSEVAKKMNSKRQRKATAVSPRKATPVMKSKRNAARKTVKYAETSSDSSDDEALATMKQKLTKAPREQKTAAKAKTTKPKLQDKSLKGSSSDDNDEPLENLFARKKPAKKNTTPVSQVNVSRKRRGLSDESSEDEPLINLVKKRGTKNKMKAPRKRNATPKKQRKIHESGSSSNSSDDEPLIKAAKHPQVTKIVRIILERCDGEETQSLKKNDTATAEKTLSKESEGSAETSEEE